jgi:amino acid adenylation domain-containing protein
MEEGLSADSSAPSGASTRRGPGDVLPRAGGRAPAAAGPGRPVTGTAAGTARPGRPVPEEWCGTTRSVPATTLPQLFQEQVGRMPDATAVVCGTEAMSYTELNARANRLARFLVSLGAGPERLVAVALPRSLDLVVAAFAVLKSGAAYLPVDPAYPAERTAFMLGDARPVAVLTTALVGQSLPGGTPQVALDDPAVLAVITRLADADVADAERLTRLRPSNPAYVIYTSGSTGRPKGVVIEHRSVVGLLCWACAEFAANELSKVLASTSLSFDVSVFEIFGPLVSGGSIEIVRDLLALADGGGESWHGSLISAVPSALSEVLSVHGTKARARTVVLAGEALTAHAVAAIRAALPGAAVRNIYGPTETTVYATAWRAGAAGEQSADGNGDGAPPIGRPVWNTSVHVLDDGLSPVPVGVAGELYLAGTQLARGYLNRPALTAERFVACPFGSEGRRMYRTGDLARWNAAGELEYLGRVDDQVKVRGFRIELGEIEAVLAGQPGVAQAALAVRQDRPGGGRLVAYVVPAAGHQLAAPALRAAAALALPDYMVPAAVVVLDRLPLNANGKLDRAALPAPEFSTGPGGLVPFSPPPASSREKAMCELFAQVLGLDEVRPHDNFFDLGGHSLLATRLISRARSALGVELPIRAVFENPTAAMLAGSADLADGGRPALAPKARSDRLPLSFAQQRLWFQTQLQGPNPAHNIALAWRLRGRLDAGALAAAVGDITRRHESLRTVFPVVDGQPFQHVIDAGVAAPEVTIAAARASDLPGLLTRAARHAFDLASDLPVRAWLYRLTAQQHVLVLVTHHIASDGWSMDVVMQDLARAYLARCAGRAPDWPDWPDLPVQYADYALWQRELLGGDDDPGSELSRQASYWTSALAGLPEQLDLPYDRPRPAEPTYRGAEVSLRLDADLHRRLLGLARDHHVTLFMVVQAALAALLTRSGAGADIPIGAAVAGRIDEATANLVGFFVNTLVLRVDVDGDPSLAELLDRVRDADLAAFAHQDLPFERVVGLVNPARSASRHPLFQVMLISEDDADVDAGDWRLPGLAARAIPLTVGAATFDLTLTYRQQLGSDGAPGGIRATLTYARDLFDHATVEALAARLNRLLRQAARHPHRPVTALEILTPRERHQLLFQWNEAAAREAPRATLPELFQRQAARTPGAIAVAHGDGALSYADLNARANQLARLLESRGAGPERLVAVAMDRSPELVVAVLAVLKSGAAYLPVEPGYPADRIGFMLAESGAFAVLTTGAARQRLPAGPRYVVLDDPAVAAELGSLPGGDLAGGELPGSPAYVIYTSGSTGRPKGVVVSHAGIVNYLARQHAEFGLTGADRFLHKASISFDASAWEIFVPLTIGGTVVVARPDGQRDPAYLAQLIRDQRVTVAAFVPSMLRVFLAEPGAAECLSLRQVRSGGEELSVIIRDQLFDVLPGAELHNGYGPTEVTVGIFSRECLPEDRAARIPIGRPDWNIRAYVLDARLQPVPAGVRGELYVAGPQLARCYLGRPGLTAERFVPCPFGPAGERMYRTGDLVRWDAAGELVFLGRADGQVKVRGFRVELGEIEAVLAARDDVAQAAVVVQEDPLGDRLVAYVVPAAGHTLDATALRQAAATALPGYMVPAAVVELDALPLSATGKLDRRALPAATFTAGPGSRQPASDSERTVCDLFARVLEVDQVGPDDSFFDLGGHSLLAAMLLARLRQQFGLTISLKTFLDNPSASGIAHHMNH